MAVEVGEHRFVFVDSLAFPVAQNLDGPLPESLVLELYDSNFGFPPLAPGTFALGEGLNDNFATCQHCVWLPLDWDPFATDRPPLERMFFATQGTVTLTEVTDPLGLTFAGATSEIVLREAVIDENFVSTLVEGGRCLRVAGLTFDTRPVPGRACLSAEECNPDAEVCSPVSNTCVATECAEFGTPCPGERPVCLSQIPGVFGAGACYADCNPTTNAGCPNGMACVQTDVDPAVGICKHGGGGQLGSACRMEDTSTSCERGLVCSEEGFCTRTCRFFDEDPGCQEGTQCTLAGVCATGAGVIDVAPGEPCGEDAAFGQDCAPDGEAHRGICFSATQAPPFTCEELCFGDLGCDAGEYCSPTFLGGLGLCRPQPECGDGELAELGEACDDGNHASNDGCSADCQEIEYGPICEGAPLLAPNSTVLGDTNAGWDGFRAVGCQLGLARADVYRFVPPGRGRLRLSLESATAQLLSLRADCDEERTELRCSGSFELSHTVAGDSEEIVVLVSGLTVLDEGPYTLNVEWTDEACGDGVIAGREACDDGNTLSGDGCSADCGAIEFATFYCPAATPLVAGATIQGEIASGPSVFAGSCEEDLQSGPDRLYRYTAPEAGRLRLELAPTPEPCLLTLSVSGGCDAPGVFPDQACASTFGDPLALEVPVDEGETLFVLAESAPFQESCSFTLLTELLQP